MQRLLPFVAIAICLLGTGCTLYQPRSVTYTVRDGDTGQPIEGAKISFQYLTMFDFGVWYGSIGPREGTTDKDGKLTLIFDPDKVTCHMSLTADGYPRGNGDLLSPR